MFAVIGQWEMDPELADVRRETLEFLVAGVRQAPGLTDAYWAEGSETRSHTFIVFNDRSTAEAFAADVRANAVNQARAGVKNLALDIAEVVASAQPLA